MQHNSTLNLAVKINVLCKAKINEKSVVTVTGHEFGSVYFECKVGSGCSSGGIFNVKVITWLSPSQAR